MRIGAWSLAALVGGVNAACINFRPPPAPLPAEVTAGAPAEVWSQRIGRAFSRRIATDGAALYAASFDRKVYAVDIDSGSVRWSERLGGPAVGGVLRDGDLLFVGTARPEGRVYALHTETGDRAWRVKAGEITAPLALADGLVLAQNVTGHLVAIDAADGEVRWRRLIGSGRSAPVAAGAGHVIVATLDSLFRIATADGRVTAQRPAPGAVVSEWVGLGGTLVAGTTDSLVVAIDPVTLEMLWCARLDAPVLAPPAVHGDTLYVVSRIGSVYRMVPGPGHRPERIAALQWPATTAPILYDGLIVLGGADGVVRAVGADGAEAWRLQVWRPIDVTPIQVPDGLLVIGGNGDVHLYSP